MLDRAHRLTTSAGFGTATRRGRRAGTRTLVLHLHVPVGSQAQTSEALASPPLGPPHDPPVDPLETPSPRVGFVVGRSVGNAVRRNRVKRRLREVARGRLALVPAEALLVVRALPAAADATYAGLAADFDGALRRLDVSVPPAADHEPDLASQSEAAPGQEDTAGTVHRR